MRKFLISMIQIIIMRNSLNKHTEPSDCKIRPKTKLLYLSFFTF